ncbi:MAG: transcription termination factor NusA [Puniceicoccales bacterium]|jgi:N utilization substance protein A|nr:transcription termination factor NusA [Puniceicoccales bacterium]
MGANSQILSVLEYMEREKGIARSDMIETISEAIRVAALKSVNAGHDVRIEINPKNGNLQAWAVFEVVDSVSDPKTQIHLSKALLVDENARIGSVIEKEIDPALLGRIAAQTTRQAIMQRIRFFEREKLYDDFKGRVGDIVSGTIRNIDGGNLYIDVNGAEAIMPARERIRGEEFTIGERIRCLLLKLDPANRDAELILSRSHVNFVLRLLEIEVSEIADGSVAVKGIAREPGYRTKISVCANDKNIDPVGACVGARGVRIKSIVRELNGEKIDVIRYSDDPEKLLIEAIKPAVPKNIRVDHGARRIYFEVAEGDLAVAIGKRGLNAKLTSRMMNWKLDISKENATLPENFGEKFERAAAGLHGITGVGDEQAKKLVAAGITDIDAFEGVSVDDLVEVGFEADEAQKVLDSVQNFCKKVEKRDERQGVSVGQAIGPR